MDYIQIWILKKTRSVLLGVFLPRFSTKYVLKVHQGLEEVTIMHWWLLNCKWSGGGPVLKRGGKVLEGFSWKVGKWRKVKSKHADDRRLLKARERWSVFSAMYWCAKCYKECKTVLTGCIGVSSIKTMVCKPMKNRSLAFRSSSYLEL